MGTSIKLEAIKGERTTKEQWDSLINYFEDNDYNPLDDGDFITLDTIYCPYSCAYINSQLNDSMRESLKGSDITINLWYEEREPDETLCFEVEE